MPVVSKLFAAYGFVLLLIAFSCPYIFPDNFMVTFRLAGRGYAFPPASVSIWLAAVSCSFAAIYSLYMLAFSKAAEVWHFGITALATSLTLVSFYWLFIARLDRARGVELTGLDYVVACVFMSASVVALSAQGIFIFNFVRAIVRKM